MNEEFTPDSEEAEEPVLSEQEAQMALDVLRSEQNLVGGTIIGLVAAVTGAAIWALVTVITEYQIGWMAVGIGFLVGFAVQFGGKGIDQVFGIVGGVLSLFGCALGNVVTITYFVALSEGIPFVELLLQLDPSITIEMLTATFEIMDVLFYGLAVYFGYKYAFRQVTLEDLQRALEKGHQPIQ